MRKVNASRNPPIPAAVVPPLSLVHVGALCPPDPHLAAFLKADVRLIPVNLAVSLSSIGNGMF